MFLFVFRMLCEGTKSIFSLLGGGRTKTNSANWGGNLSFSSEILAEAQFAVIFSNTPSTHFISLPSVFLAFEPCAA